MLSQLYYVLLYSFSLAISVIGLIACLSMLIVIVSHSQCRTPLNLPICSTAVSIFLVLSINIINCFYGFREDWISDQPLCRLRAYLIMAIGGVTSYSYLIQSIQRLFINIYYKKKYLVNYKAHLYMIILNWLIPFSCTAVPLFFQDAFRYEAESRLCILTIKKYALSAYVMTSQFLIPFSAGVAVYLKILFYAIAAPKITPSAMSNHDQRMNNLKREKKVARQMIKILGINCLMGVPYLVFILWYGIDSKSLPPEPLYLLFYHMVILGIAVTMLSVFRMNKQIMGIIFARLGIQQNNIDQPTVQRWRFRINLSYWQNEVELIINSRKISICLCLNIR